MKLSLRLLILGLALLTVVLTLLGSTLSGYFMNKQNLIDNTLETNRVYAQKLASTTDLFFRMTLQTLEQSSLVVANWMAEPEGVDHLSQLMAEANRLRLQTDTLNSIIIASAEGEVVATSPQSLDLLGRILTTEGGQQALRERRPIISEPYMSITDRLIIFISHPVFAQDGTYLGFVGGSLYLREQNFLRDLLGDHFYDDGSYVYVVDPQGYIIYHNDTERISDQVTDNPVVQKLMNQHSGAERVINTKGIDMLAGYAYVPTASWGIVVQRPTEAALQPNEKMIKQMFIQTIPILLVAVLIIFIVSHFIASPLQKLALLTQASTKNNQQHPFDGVKAWYYEAIQLKRVLTKSLDFWHDKVDHITQQSHTDPLTKLTNRRTMDMLINQWMMEKKSFALIIVDIDHFKRINDTYGHGAGDQVLVYLANKMKSAVVAEKGVCCRYGGEEFVVLLPDYNRQQALGVAERLRLSVSEAASPCGDFITISAGVADSHETVEASVLFDLADQRLYEAKRGGRNRCV